MNTSPPPTLDLALSQAINLHQRGRLAEAEAGYRQILAADCQHAKALVLLGVCLYTRGEHGQALANIDAAIALEPDIFQAHYNRGLVLKSLNRLEDALASFDTAIRLGPGIAAAYCNKANVLKLLNRLDEALHHYDRSIALDPRLAEAYNNRGAIMQMRADFPEALRHYNRAIELNPRYAQAYGNRGLILTVQHQFTRALADFDQAIRLGVVQPYILGHWLQTKKILCDWDGIEQGLERMLAAVDRGERVAVPFGVAALPATLAQQLRTAELYAADKHPVSRESHWQLPPYRHERIRIGYFSADYHDHATSHLIADLIERHDRERFEVIGLSFGPDQQDAMRTRMVRAFDAFHDVRDMTDAQVVGLARDLEIDIAVDLKGHTFDARTGIFAGRAAPIQVNYLGYPGTMAVPYMDYLIADPTLIPPEHRPFYTEKIAYLPHTYQANDATKAIAAQTPTRREQGLPEAGFVYCCFNNSYKISPEVFAIWMRLLSNTPGSVLWLLASNAEMVANLRAEAGRRGVAPERLVFAPRATLAEHLARHRLADLFVDCFYYNAHTTASDALWAGLPVLTVLGESFAGRVAASLLRAIGLPDMVTSTHQEYEASALELARDPARLSAIRARLAANRATHPLFNPARFTRHLEQAYRRMWQRHEAGSPPEDIVVEA